MQVLESNAGISFCYKLLDKICRNSHVNAMLARGGSKHERSLQMQGDSCNKFVCIGFGNAIHVEYYV